jgi:hypothetical protein
MQHLQPGFAQPEFAVAIASERHRQLAVAVQRARQARRSASGGISWRDAFLAHIGTLLIGLGRKLQSPLLRRFPGSASREPYQRRLVLAATASPSSADCGMCTERGA